MLATPSKHNRIRAAAALLICYGLVGCAPSGAAPFSTAHGATGGVCRAEESQRFGLALPDGDPLYVEPQAIHPIEGGFLIAGAPTYEWRFASDGSVTRVNDERFVGAFVRNGTVQTVDKPQGLRSVGWVRLAPLGADRWAWLLQEVKREGDRTETTRIVYAESQGGQWTTSEDLIVPPGGQLHFPTSSPLTASGRGVAWVVPFHADDRTIGAMLYERVGGTWSFRSVAEDWIDEVALFPAPNGGLRVGVGGLDEDHEYQRVSLRILPEGGRDARAERVFVAEPGDRVRSIRAMDTGPNVATSWLVVGRGESVQWALWGRRETTSKPLVVDPSAITSVSVVTPDEITLIVTHHVEDETSLQELRVHHLGPTGAPVIAALPHPFLGYFTAVSAEPGEVTVVGPEFDPRAAHPFVRSLVLRLSISCT